MTAWITITDPEAAIVRREEDRFGKYSQNVRRGYRLLGPAVALEQPKCEPFDALDPLPSFTPSEADGRSRLHRGR